MAEKEIEHLIENLKLEKRRYVELEKKLGDSNSCITCSQQKSLEITLVKTKTKLDELDFSDFDKVCRNFVYLTFSFFLWFSLFPSMFEG